jgi:hypothetical protein
MSSSSSPGVLPDFDCGADSMSRSAGLIIIHMVSDGQNTCHRSDMAVE